MTGESADVWITPCWGTWVQDGMSATMLDRVTASRAYQHWHLAEEDAHRVPQDDVRRGAVMQRLWNAVDFRVRLLHDIYELRRLSGVLGWESEKPNLLEILTRVGLVRPLALRQLQRIRNTVEHADRGAPSHEECLNFIDIVWYFLRSTDLFTTRRILHLDLAHPTRDSETDRLFVSFDFEDQSWLPGVRGWLPQTAVSTVENDHSLRIQLHKAPTVGGDSIYVSGVTVPGSPMLANLVSRYFLVDLPDSSRAVESAEEQPVSR
ncbi:hypothetical protein [Mycolicibacterium sp. HK-90]|uniref:hypothetical protein n=1 Tax=Mycolicibacterium sp. HK-90 TaxID=3056937 RepID=UPI00265A7171|nr:hypothetical protein [Mycolicibacterium sp. HK-90]WKG02177.1 hypothetical protein QU592_23560 [Mycolicibacterium sp. HK-90]